MQGEEQEQWRGRPEGISHNMHEHKFFQYFMKVLQRYLYKHYDRSETVFFIR